MIPQLQTDYSKYSQIFRGNSKKGASLFRSLLGNPETAEQLISSDPAMAAVFTDFYKREANRQCWNVLAEKPFYEDALMTYLRSMDMTKHITVAELLADTANVLKIFREPNYNPTFQEKNDLIRKTLLSRNIYNALSEDRNSDAALLPGTLRSYAANLKVSSVNIYSAFSRLWNTIQYKVSPFSPSEQYYDISMQSEWAIVSEEANAVFMPGWVSTRYTPSSKTYYYYPCVFKYSIDTQGWTLLGVFSTDVKDSGTSYNSRTAYGLAYDAEKDNLYVFHKISQNGSAIVCDIVKGADGTLVNSVKTTIWSNSTLHAPIFCCFDRESNLAKYVWVADSMNTTSTQPNGWLNGCSVGPDGIVWEGSAARPFVDNPSNEIYNAYAISGAKYRFPNGALVGAYHTGKDTAYYPAILVSVHSSGDKVKASYLQLEANTQSQEIYKPSDCYIMNNGLAVLLWNSSIYWGTGGSRYVTAILEITEDELKLHNTIFTSYNLRIFTPFKKIALQSGERCTIVGLDGSGGIIKRDYTETFSQFEEARYPAREPCRYQLRTPYNAWTLHDYEAQLQ